MTYAYDADGNIVNYFDGTNPHTFTYDFAGRLQSWTYQGNTVQYDYDAAGNLKNPHGKTLTFNAANEVEGFSYDEAGNLLQDDKYQYEWDGEGRLLTVKDLNGNAIASFTYHPDGLRKTKTVGSTTYHYHYDGSDLIRITDDNGQTVWAFTWANGKPNTVTNSNGNTFYYVTNYRGDVMRIVDENGATVASYSYDPWGKVLSASEDAAVSGQPLGYAGYYYDKETNLYYLQARYYDPETARFISRDPNPGDLDNPISQNGYVYVDNNPITYVDPDGNKSKKPKNDPTDTVLTVTTALVSLVSTLREMGIYFLKVSWHAAERMIEREVTSKMIAKAIKHGKVYYDPWYSSYVYYYNGLAVAVTKGKTITTVYWGKPKKRWIKIK